MKLTLDALMKGKAIRIKNRDYYKTEAYVTPFIERLSKITDQFLVQAILPSQMSITKEEDLNLEDTMFNRVWIQALLPDDIGVDNHQSVIGMVYGLDVKKPVAKIYKGGLNQACTNLCIFSPAALSVQNIEPECPLDFKAVDRLIEEQFQIKTYLDGLQNMELPYEQVNEKLGQWIRNTIRSSYSADYGNVKLATSAAIDAYKLLYENTDSPYYVKQNQPTNMFNVYNAWTQTITDDTRDIMNKAEKTLLLKRILSI